MFHAEQSLAYGTQVVGGVTPGKGGDTVLGKVPGKPFTTDNYRSLQIPSTCSEDGLSQLGIEATDMDAVVPWMLGSKR